MTKSTNYLPYIARTLALTTKEVITKQTRGPNISLPS